MNSEEGQLIPEPVKSIMRDLMSLQAQLGAEAVDGLYSMIEASQDVTCSASKRMSGARDKKYGNGNIFKR